MAIWSLRDLPARESEPAADWHIGLLHAAVAIPGKTDRDEVVITTDAGLSSFTIFGGVHAPYIWLRTRNGATSWEFFDRLLNEAQVVGTPGAGFGPAGEGYFRLSAFNSRANVEEAVARLRKAFA